MKIIDINDLSDYDICLSNISAVKMVPINRVLSHKDVGRDMNGFLYITEGSCRYEYSGGTFEMNAGSLAYLPRGSKHTYIATSEYINYIRINFLITEVNSKEELLFSDRPKLLFPVAPLYYDKKSKELALAFMQGNKASKLKCSALLMGYLYNCVVDISKSHNDFEFEKIHSAIEFLESNYLKDDYTIKYLADLCQLSQTHFRRLFKKHTGMSPMEFKINIKINKACQLLKNSPYNISQVSEKLGFENVYYFSRIFKKTIGMPPKDYRTHDVYQPSWRI